MVLVLRIWSCLHHCHRVSSECRVVESCWFVSYLHKKICGCGGDYTGLPPQLPRWASRATNTAVGVDFVTYYFANGVMRITCSCTCSANSLSATYWRKRREHGRLTKQRNDEIPAHASPNSKFQLARVTLTDDLFARKFYCHLRMRLFRPTPNLKFLKPLLRNLRAQTGRTDWHTKGRTTPFRKTAHRGRAAR